MSNAPDWSYAPDTGHILRDGKVVGSKDSAGYLVVWHDGKCKRAHRLAFELMGVPVPKQVDHINGVRDDNRWCNLRAASNMQNQYNRKGTSKQGHKKGAYFNKRANAWYSLIRYNGKREYLGHFRSEDAAHCAYVRRSKEVHGEYSRDG